MSTLRFRKPRVASPYTIWAEPPDESGEEALHFASERRRVKLKGRSFREFGQRVLPLLDGTRTVDEIQTEVADLFRPDDLFEGLSLLADHNLLEEGDLRLSPDLARRLAPQLSFFHELGLDPEVIQGRLATTTVAIVGLGGIGADVARALAVAGVGRLRVLESLPVVPTDAYLSTVFRLEDIGRARSERLGELLRDQAPRTDVTVADGISDGEDDFRASLDGCNFAVNCLDAGQVNLAYKINRMSLQTGLRWTSCALQASEVALGPTVYPFDGPCYMCYRMRAIAAAANPEDAFAYERRLDARKTDDGGRRDNLSCGAGVAANLAALEALKELTGFAAPTAAGRLVIFNLLDLSVTRHVVLRKPWCPACFGHEPDGRPRWGEPSDKTDAG